MPFRLLTAALAAATALAVPAYAADLNWEAEPIATLNGLVDIRLEHETGAVIARTEDKHYRLVRTGDAFSLEPTVSKERPLKGADPIPDGRVASGTGAIAKAWLSEPTLLYQHGVLGDNVEAEMLRVQTRDGRLLSYKLPNDSVFEDLEPRIIGLNGEEAVLVVRSYLSAGASIALYRVNGDALEPIGESDPIGLSHRWLNPVGAADFDGDGITEIAAVVTPHLSGLLTIYQWDGERFVKDRQRGGYSTHFIGSTILAMSVVDDVDGNGVPEIILPTLDRDALAVVGFSRTSSKELLSLPFESKIVTSVIMANMDERAPLDIVFGLEDGTLMLIRR